MGESSKPTSSHLRRQAFIYARQSSQAQVERNVEWTDLQYAVGGARRRARLHP
jgi:hypothetical protein